MATVAQVRRGAVLGAAALTALAGAVLPATPADAAAGRCPAGTGVTVVVDYGPLNGNQVDIGCDPDGADSAMEAMEPAGFQVQNANGQPFVCRINGLPDESQESCARTPPEDAYWALFWSDGKSSTWNYSSSGAASLEVPEGGSIGWRFQDGGARENPGAPPTAAEKNPAPPPSGSPSPEPSKPPKAADPTPTPTPSASVPPGTVGSGKSPDEKADPDGPEQPGGKQPGRGKGDDKGDDGKGDKGGKGDRRPKDKANPQQAAKPSESPAVAAVEPASGEPYADDDSSTALTVVAGGAVLLLAGAAGVIGWRRRG